MTGHEAGDHTHPTVKVLGAVGALIDILIWGAIVALASIGTDWVMRQIRRERLAAEVTAHLVEQPSAPADPPSSTT